MNEVVVSSASGLAQTIISGPYQMLADEPIEVGGSGTGPSPYEILLASLGACTSMTLRLYAARKGWELGSVVVRLRHYRVHQQDCTDCEKPGAFLDRIDSEIELGGLLTDEQKARLQVIAESCPVHRTLKRGTNIRTKLLDGLGGA